MQLLVPADRGGYFANVQALRALAVLPVLFYHLHIVEAKYFDAHSIAEVIGRYGLGGVDLFFTISGFVMVVATRERFDEAGTASRFLLARMLRIYPIYWFYTLVVLAVMMLRPAWVNSSSAGYSLLASFTLFPSEHLPLVIQGWTLSYEMYFYLVFALAIALVPRRMLPLWLAAWAGLTVVGHGVLRADRGGPVLALLTDLLTLEFMAGCVAGLICHRLSRGQAVVVLALGLLACAGGLVLADSQDYQRVIELRTFYFGAPAFLIVLGAAALELRSTLRPPRVLVYLGEASYSIYLSHLLALAAVGRLWQATLLPYAGPALGTVVCALVALVGGCLSYEWIERPLIRHLRRWVLARRRPVPAVVQRP